MIASIMDDMEGGVTVSLAQKKTTVPYPSVGADEEQSLKFKAI